MRVSVTEFEKYLECRQAWHYSHRLKLRKIDTERASEPLVVGRAVAETLERTLLLEPDPAKRAAFSETEIRTHDLDPVLEERALKCLAATPDWVWEMERPVAEDKMEVKYPNDLTIVGIPDIWYIEKNAEGEQIAVHVVEVKTGGAASMPDARRRMDNYVHFGMQPTRYCTLLYDTYPWLRDLPFYRRYLYLATKGFSVESEPWAVNQTMIDRTRADMLSLAEEMVAPRIARSEGRRCDWCEYAPITLAHLTGGEPDDIIGTLYEPKPRRER